MASLQNGDKLFVNYCLNCHSANSMRYNKLADLGLTDKEIKKNLLFTGEKVGDLMHVAMRPTDAAKWFGTAPPDLSVIARAKGIDFIRSEEHTSELQSLMRISYAVFCLKKKK